MQQPWGSQAVWAVGQFDVAFFVNEGSEQGQVKKLKKGGGVHLSELGLNVINLHTEDGIAES